MAEGLEGLYEPAGCFARTCVLMEKKRVPDGAGGYMVQWEEGAEFTNYQALDTSMEAQDRRKRGRDQPLFRSGRQGFPD